MAESPRSQNREPELVQDVSPLALAGLGMQFFVAILLFLYVGNWLDRRLGSSPLFLLAGVLLGGGGVFYSGYRRLTAAQRDARAPHDGPDDRTSAR